MWLSFTFSLWESPAVIKLGFCKRDRQCLDAHTWPFCIMCCSPGAKDQGGLRRKRKLLYSTGFIWNS